MITIQSIGTYVPPDFELNADKLEKFGFNQDFLDHKIGVERIPRKSSDEETSDMCVRAFSDLQDKTDVAIDDVDLIVVCTQNPDGNGIPHTSAIVHAKLGAPTSCAAFDISLACSGYVYGLSAAQSFMEANGLKKGLFFTCDPYSKILDPEDRNTALLFGDAATVTLLAGPDSGFSAWRPTKFRFSTHSEFKDDVHNKNGYFSMDGNAVVRFTLRTVPGEVLALLKDAGLTPDEVDLFIFHQGSKYIVDGLAQRLGLPPEKVPVDIVDTGNTVSSSIPLVFQRYLDRPDIRRVIFNGFGVGISLGSCIVENRTQIN